MITAFFSVCSGRAALSTFILLPLLSLVTEFCQITQCCPALWYSFQHVDKLKTFVTHLHLITLQNELLEILYVYRIQEVKKISYGFELFKIKDMNNVSKMKKIMGKAHSLERRQQSFSQLYQMQYIPMPPDRKRNGLQDCY